MRNRTACAPQLHPLLARGDHPFAHLPRLHALVACKHELGRKASVALGPQLLSEPEPVLLGDGVCDRENRSGGAIVALELRRVSVRKLRRKVKYVAGTGGAKTVDRLEVVADDRQLRPCAAKASHDVDLQAVDVLVLVHQHVVESVSHAWPDHLVGRERAPVQEQVVEIEKTERALAHRVGAEGLRERVAMLGAPRKRLRQHLRQRRLGVDRARVDVEHRLRAREAPAARGVTLLLAHEVEQVGRVARVEDPEAGSEPERGGVESHHPVGD